MALAGAVKLVPGVEDAGTFGHVPEIVTVAAAGAVKLVPGIVNRRCQI